MMKYLTKGDNAYCTIRDKQESVLFDIIKMFIVYKQYTGLSNSNSPELFTYGIYIF